MTDDFLTFKYEQADRKHRTGQKLTEDEWEALLAGERAKAEIDEANGELVDELTKQVEELEAKLDALQYPDD